MRYLILFVLTSIPLCAFGSLCETLPFHGDVLPMTTTSPFHLVTSVSTAHQREILTVRIKSVLSELNFGGFMIHAHSTSFPYKVVSVINCVMF